MKKIINLIKIGSKYIATFVVVLIITILMICLSVKAQALDVAVSEYTTVVSDLESDKEFSIYDYPNKENDYSVQVIQIAETSLGGLMIYTYTPSHPNKEYVASYVNSSLKRDIGETKIYPVKLLSQEGVLAQYLVNDVVVDTSKTYR